MVFFRHFRLQPYCLPLLHPWVDAHGQTSYSRGLIVVLETPKGRVGLGDCAPLPSHGTENPQEAESFLDQVRQRFCEGTVQALLSTLPISRKRFPAACAAVETACLDLLAQAEGVCLARFLTPKASHKIKANAIIGPLNEQAASRARQAASEGFCVIKVKAGITKPQAEAAALAELAGSLPDGVQLRIDVNGAWSPAQAALVLTELRDLPVESVEDPSSRASLAALADLQSLVPFPLALDESLTRLGAEAVLEARPVRRLVLKAPAAGGLSSAQRIARRANLVGMETVVTTALDSAVGAWAACHLAAATDPKAEQYHGLAASSWSNENTAPPPKLDKDAIHLPNTPGLSLKLQTDYPF